MAVPKLVEAVRYAFAPTGPIHRVLGQHRPAQNEFAATLATYIDRRNDDGVSALLREAFAGCGKTDAVLTVLGLDTILTDRRSLISTFKRSLRSDYLAAMSAVNTVIELTLHGLEGGRLVRRLSIGEYKSPMTYLSPTKLNRLMVKTRTGQIKTTQSIAEFIQCYEELVNAGLDPEFTDLYELCQLPTDTTELHWAFCSSDRQTELWQRIREQNAEARHADILLVTHAMLIRNSIARGAVLNTSDQNSDVTEGQNSILRDGIAMIDEAEKLPGAAHDAVTAEVSLIDLRELVADVMAIYSPSASRKGDSVLNDARRLVETGLDTIGGWLESNHRRSIVFNGGDEPSVNMIDTLHTVDDGLRQFLTVAKGELHENDSDVMLTDEIGRVRQEIAIILRAPSFDFAKMAIRAVHDEHGVPDVQITVNFSSGRHLMTQLWRNQHSFAGVAMISATLTDLPPYQQSYSRFLAATGYDATVDRILHKQPVTQQYEQFGRIAEVIVPDRLAPHPTDPADVNHINAAFVEFAAIGLTALAKRQQTATADTRMLVLFPSYRLLDRVRERLPGLQHRINRTRRGSNMRNAIAAYAGTEYGIWFGVEWEGVNFIHPTTRRTLADLMAIVRLPQPPSDDIRIARLADVFGDTVAAQRRAEWVALREANMTAYRKTIQGVARGIRNAADVVQALMILDIRFPVPYHVADTRKIARAGGDPAKLFAAFDACVAPYGVGRWTQLNLDGSFTRIL